MADTQQVRQEVETIKDDIRKMREDLVSLLKTVRTKGQRDVSGASSRLQEEAMHRFEQLKDVLDDAKTYSQKAYVKAYKKLEDRPLIGVAAAFVIGAVLGSLLFKRRR